jgi:hypothetical protein
LAIVTIPRVETTQKAVLAVPTARLVLQFPGDNLRHDDIVRDDRKDVFAIPASVQIDKNTRVENKRISDVSQGA